MNGVEPRNDLDKYGIDIELDGSLRRSKKKKKKMLKQKSKMNGRMFEAKDERSRLAFILDNSNEESQVRINTTLVDKYGPTEHCHFDVVPGEKVVARYRKGDFINVIRSDGLAGFVPVKICFLVAEEHSVAMESRNGSSPSIKSSTPVSFGTSECGTNQGNSDLSLHKSPEPSDEPEIVDGREVNSGMEQVAKDEDGNDRRPTRNGLTETNDFECDSLARKVRMHEIRQLLKRDTSQKIFDSNTNVKELVDGDKISNNEIAKEVDSKICKVDVDNRSIQKMPIYNQTALISSESQSLNLQNSNLSLNAKIEVKRSEHEKKTSSKLSLNSIHSRGSQQSLNSLKSKHYSTTKPNMILQNKLRHVGINQPSRFDNHSLSSYDGSLQEIYSRLNGELFHNSPQPSGGFFYQRNNPQFSNETRVHELLNENRFARERRCSSLRRGTNYAWLPQNHVSGYGHGYSPRLMDDERAWKYYAESVSAPGSRVMSPSLYENSLQMNEGNILASETTLFAIRDFQAIEKEELSVRKGERVVLLKRESEDWCWVMNSRGEEGLVPSYFLIPLLKPSQQDVGMFNDSMNDLVNSQYRIPLHHQKYQDFGQERRNQEQNVVHVGPERVGVERVGVERVGVGRVGAECDHQEHDKPNGLIRSNTIGSDSRGLKGSKIDWRKLYINESGPTGYGRSRQLNMAKGKNDDVKSKEELLKRIRNEVMKDPMKEYLRKRSLSNENMHKISTINDGAEKGLSGTLRRRELLDDTRDLKHTPATTEKEVLKEYSENIAKSGKQNHCKIELPSYEQCIDHISRDHNITNQNNVSMQESDMFETPRILRRRRTYSGGSNRKVRVNNGRNEDEEKLKNIDKHEAKNDDDVDNGLSTWC